MRRYQVFMGIGIPAVVQGPLIIGGWMHWYVYPITVGFLFLVYWGMNRWLFRDERRIGLN